MTELGCMKQLLGSEEVEWKAIGEVGELVRGNGLPKTDFTDLGVPAIHYGQIYTHYGLSTSSTISFVSKDTAKKLKKVDCGDVIITNTSENFEDVGKALVYLGKEQAVTGGHATILKPSGEILGKYFAYFTQTREFANQKRKYAKGIKVTDVSATDLSKMYIPIPSPNNPKRSLEIQAGIVRTLDAFSTHTQVLAQELVQELIARRNQYNYYRDLLLSFQQCEVESKTLSWVGDVRMCKRILKSQTTELGDIPFFKIGTFGREPNSYISREIFEEYKGKYNYPRIGEVLISASGTIGRTVIFDGNDAYFQDSNIVWIENDESKVLNKYLYYFYQIANWHVSEGGTIKRLYNDNIKKTPLSIPYPNDPDKSLAEQAKVIAIMDKLDTSFRFIEESLTKEIKLRQKQYEYYRDLLLSFPKPEDVGV